MANTTGKERAPRRKRGKQAADGLVPSSEVRPAAEEQSPKRRKVGGSISRKMVELTEKKADTGHRRIGPEWVHDPLDECEIQTFHWSVLNKFLWRHGIKPDRKKWAALVCQAARKACKDSERAIQAKRCADLGIALQNAERSWKQLSNAPTQVAWHRNFQRAEKALRALEGQPDWVLRRLCGPHRDEPFNPRAVPIDPRAMLRHCIKMAEYHKERSPLQIRGRGERRDLARAQELWKAIEPLWREWKKDRGGTRTHSERGAGPGAKFLAGAGKLLGWGEVKLSAGSDRPASLRLVEHESGEPADPGIQYAMRSAIAELGRRGAQPAKAEAATGKKHPPSERDSERVRKSARTARQKHPDSTNRGE